jgi:hypothetical protein
MFSIRTSKREHTLRKNPNSPVAVRTAALFSQFPSIRWPLPPASREGARGLPLQTRLFRSLFRTTLRTTLSISPVIFCGSGRLLRSGELYRKAGEVHGSDCGSTFHQMGLWSWPSHGLSLYLPRQRDMFTNIERLRNQYRCVDRRVWIRHLTEPS